MNNYKILMTKQAKKDLLNYANSPSLKKNVDELIQLLKEDPLKMPPYLEKLVGDLKGAYSRRINKQHRLVYTIHEKDKEVIILRAWTHYE